MDHPDPQELQLFADDELNGRKAQAVAAHLDGCSECGEAIERIRTTGDLLRLAVDEIIADAPLEGFADSVLEQIEAEAPLTWSERLKTWFGEFYRYRQRFWGPSLALASGTAAVLLVLIFFGGESGTTPSPDRLPSLPPVDLVPGSSVLSVSFGNSVDGTVFEVEDKDGSTTAVIWVDEAKSISGENTGAFRGYIVYPAELLAFSHEKAPKLSGKVASTRQSPSVHHGKSGAKHA